LLYLREITSRFKKLVLIRFHKTLFMSALYHLQNKSALLRAIEKSFTDTSRDEHRHPAAYPNKIAQIDNTQVP